MTTLSDFTATSLDGQERAARGTYDGQVALVVNTASQCGFTPQLEGLRAAPPAVRRPGPGRPRLPLQPVRQPGARAATRRSARSARRTTASASTMFAKVDVNGDDAHPVYKWLREEKRGLLGEKIKWNFTKFLVGKDGQVIKRYGSTTKPEKIAGDIEKALSA